MVDSNFSIQYCNMTQHELHQLVKSLTDGLGLETPDLDLFDLGLEQEFAERVAKGVELFSQSPDRLLQELEEILSDLHWLEGYFAAREEYERCLIVQSQRGILERKILYARRKKGQHRVSFPKRPK